MSQTRNPFRFCKDSSEYKAWQSGYEKDFFQMSSNPYQEISAELYLVYLEGEAAKLKDESVIPLGTYCYDSNNRCPHWGVRNPKNPEQDGKYLGGYCRLTRDADWKDYMSLHNQLKCCGIKKEQLMLGIDKEITGELVSSFSNLHNKVIYSLRTELGLLDIKPADLISIKTNQGTWEIAVGVDKDKDHSVLPESLTIPQWEELFNYGLEAVVQRG